MNIEFWGVLVLMLLLAIGIMIWPLLRPKQTVSIAYKDSNLSLYEEKLQELEADLAEGRIQQAEYKLAREELDRELLADIPQENRDNAAELYAAQPGRKPALALFVAAFIPAVSLIVYMQLGMHASTQEFHQQAASGQEKLMSVADMTVILEKRLQQQDGDATAWAMLGRAYKHLGRFDDAVKAFDTARGKQDSSQLMLEQAEAMALANGQQFDAASRELVLRVLEQEPNNATAIWFAGVAEFQFGNYWQSVDHLAMLTDVAAGDEQVRQSIQFYLNESRKKLLAQGEDVQPIDEALQRLGENRQSAQPETASVGASVTVHVDVSDAVRKQNDGGAAVFVYAKAQSGPRMPLAVQRMTLADLPATVTLDDSMAMVNGMNLSTFNKVVISARISQSGSAVTQSGDFIGSIKVDNVKTTDSVDVVIDSPVP